MGCDGLEGASVAAKDSWVQVLDQSLRVPAEKLVDALAQVVHAVPLVGFERLLVCVDVFVTVTVYLAFLQLFLKLRWNDVDIFV